MSKKFRLNFPKMVERNLCWIVEMYKIEYANGITRDRWPTSIPKHWLEEIDKPINEDATHYINTVLKSKGREVWPKELAFSWIDMSDCWDAATERQKDG